MGIFPTNKKGGIVTNTVMGVGGLIIAVVVVLVLTQTVTNAGLFDDDRLGNTTHNQTVSTVNETGVFFGDFNRTNAECTILYVTNNTCGDVALCTIGVSNYTQTNCFINYSGDRVEGEYNDTAWNISSLTTYSGISEEAILGTSGNLSVGVQEISEKIPTILLIVAVVFLFGALVLLIRNANLMGVSTSGGL